MKKPQMQQDETRISKLKLNRETLRQLESSDLKHAGGGVTGPSICTQTTIQCCDTL